MPGPCLDWCRGEPLSDEVQHEEKISRKNTNIFQTSETCATSHSDTILDCFHEGRHSLPGLPRDVKVNTNILLTDISSILYKQEDVADLSSNWINPIYCRNLSVSIYPRILLRIFTEKNSPPNVLILGEAN